MSEQRKPQWTLAGRVLRKKSGDGVYLKMLKDVKADSILSVQDPRTRLTEEQQAELASNGQVSVPTSGGKTRTVYDSVQFELYEVPARN